MMPEEKAAAAIKRQQTPEQCEATQLGYGVAAWWGRFWGSDFHERRPALQAWYRARADDNVEGHHLETVCRKNAAVVVWCDVVGGSVPVSRSAITVYS